MDHVWSAQADADGVARFEDVPAGGFRARPGKGPSDGGWNYWSPWAEVRLLPSGGHLRVDVTLPARIPVTISVRDEDGRPKKGVQLELTLSGFAPASAPHEDERVQNLRPVTDEAGAATVDLFPGWHGCRVTDGDTVRMPGFRVPMAGGFTLSVVLPVVGAVLRGRVTERGSGAPVSRTPVRVYDMRGPGGALLGAGGLPAGTLWVSVHPHAGASGSQEESPNPYAQREVRVERGGHPVADFALPRIRGEGAVERTVDVDLHVIDAPSGHPLDRMHAFTLGLIDGTWLYAGSLDTDREGRAAGKVLAAGRYWILLSRESLDSPSYSPRELEGAPANGRLVFDTSLAPDPIDGR